MPDLLAGTTILAQDTPRTMVVDQETDELNITSTAFIPGTAECSTTFTAPTTGRVLVHVYLATTGDGTDQCTLSFEIYEGSSTAGTLVRSAIDNNGVRAPNEIDVQRGGISAIVSQLTPGATHFIRTMHKVTGGTTIDIFHRRLIVEPAP